MQPYGPRRGAPLKPNDNPRLCVALHEEIYAGAQPCEVGTCRHARESRTVELTSRGFCKCRCSLLRPKDAAAVRYDLMKPQHLARQAPLTRPLQKIAHPCTI